MEKYGSKQIQTQVEQGNGKDISYSEMQDIYTTLIAQSKSIDEQIFEAVDRNDFETLKQLVTKRENLHAAIESIEPLYKDEVIDKNTFSNSISNGLKDVAEATVISGEDVLGSVSELLEKINGSSHKVATKTLDAAARGISLSNKFGHHTGRFIVNQTANGLTKLANFIQKKN